MKSVVYMALLAAGVCGCSGEYIMTAPEQVASAGGEAMLVMRLQRREFAFYTPPADKKPIRFQIGKGPLRGAYTDALGYAVYYLFPIKLRLDKPVQVIA